MWEELGVNHFLKHSNHLKRNRALWLLFNTQLSDYGTTTVAKVSLYSTFTRSTISFGCLEVETGPCIAVKQNS